MPRIPTLIVCQAFLCCIEAYFVSKISFIGKTGITLFYKEYRFLRSGWKTFLLFFILQLFIILILYIVKKKLPAKIMRYTAAVLLLIALAGLWATYYDFQYTFSHRLLKERFHLGFYLFWLGWMGSCVYFLVAGMGTKEEIQPFVEERNLPDN
jgi:uncharacterized membrane protein YsdA (DUF1294 family)